MTFLMYKKNNHLPKNQRCGLWSVPEQVLTGGVWRPQREGSLRALLTSMLSPKFSATLLPSNSHKQIGLLSSSPASSGQQGLSGFVALLPASTKVRQSLTFTKLLRQGSTAGAEAEAGDEPGASAWAETPWKNAENNMTEAATMAKTLAVAMVIFLWSILVSFS